MSSLRRHEGYLLVDHRNSPGLSEADLAAARLAGGEPAVTGSGLFECATITCSHCQQTVMRNPLRKRERAYCPKCDHYLCDTCGAIRAMNGGACNLFRKLIDEVQERADKGLPVSPILLP